MPGVARVRAYVAPYRAELDAMLATEGQACKALAFTPATMMDGLLKHLFRLALAEDTTGCPPPVLLAAVGAYGRQLVGLKSELHVRLLSVEPRERIISLADALFYPLWGAGISIGHQLLTISDAVESAR